MKKAKEIGGQFACVWLHIQQILLNLTENQMIYSFLKPKSSSINTYTVHAYFIRPKGAFHNKETITICTNTIYKYH